MIETMPAQEAAEYLRKQGMQISPDAVRRGIEQGQFPFGVLVRMEGGGPRCWVFKKLLEDWSRERSIQAE